MNKTAIKHKILCIFMLLAGCATPRPAVNPLQVSHIFNRGQDFGYLRVSLEAQADTAYFEFRCHPDNGEFEPHKMPVRHGVATTTSGIRCPQKVTIQAHAGAEIYYDTLDVATIRKINALNHKPTP